MNQKIFALTAGALLLFPLGINAAELERVNHNQENNMGHHARGKKNKRGDRGRKMERLLQQLDLTSEQSEQIEAIQEQSRTAASELKEQLQTQRQEMRSLLASDATTEEIRSQHQETEELARQLSGDRFETMLQIREILTSEQRARMAELMESHRGRRFDS